MASFAEGGQSLRPGKWTLNLGWPVHTSEEEDARLREAVQLAGGRVHHLVGEGGFGDKLCAVEFWYLGDIGDGSAVKGAVLAVLPLAGPLDLRPGDWYGEFGG